MSSIVTTSCRRPACQLQGRLRVRLARYYGGTPSPQQDSVERFKELLRKTAQPVAVITACNPTNGTINEDHPYHGATLSSLTSIAMVPYPLVSFALRIPSRMATLLKQQEPLHHSSSPPTNPSSETVQNTSQTQGTMVINLLSASQASIAHKFSRADLYPHPFGSVAYTLSSEGVPILDGCLGAITCHLVAPAIPLHDLQYLSGLGRVEGSRSDSEVAQAELRSSSELFIAQVSRIEDVRRKELDEEPLDKQPLIYFHRGYTSCLDSPLLLRPKSHWQ